MEAIARRAIPVCSSASARRRARRRSACTGPAEAPKNSVGSPRTGIGSSSRVRLRVRNKVSLLRILAVWLIVLAVAGLTSAQDSIAPGRPELRPVPMPPLDSLEPVVAEQLRTAQRELQPGAGRQAGNRDLADRYGTFGQVA